MTHQDKDQELKQKADTLWKRYFESKTQGAPCKITERELVELYYPVVRKTAQRMCQKLKEVTADELASMGVDGLYHAVRNFEPEKWKAKFETYALHRIRGSMLDEIRKADFIPRLVRANFAKLDRQKQILESEAGHRLSDGEMAERLNITNEEYDCLVKAAYTPAMHSVNDATPENDQGKTLGIEHIKDQRAIQPIEKVLRTELFSKLMGSNFNKLERKIVWYYYFKDLSMKEISDEVGLSESRVSQMHGNIKERLQQKASRNPEYFEDIWEMVADFKETVV